MATNDFENRHVDVSGDFLDIDSMVDEFRSAKPADKIVEPIESGTADALTAVPTAKKGSNPFLKKAKENTAEAPAEPEVEKPVFKKRKKNRLMRMLGGLVPHVGDNAFDIIRKIIMTAGIIVFVAAATYLVDDLVLIPYNYEIMSEQREEMYYNPVLSAEEEAFPYPDGIADSFKKLYYHNTDTRGWLSFHSTDQTTIDIEYPVLQSADNDFYLMRDFNKNYNKNGSLFFDYRNSFISQNSANKNVIIYGHNMLSGQMLAGLNTLINHVSYARNATTLSMNTLYEEAQYKVFAIMVLNTEDKDGYPFGYLRTDFSDNIDFAGFLAEIKARSLYDYNGVDVRPDDEILMLSTCTSSSQVHFTEGRTVLVARKVREGEDPTVDPTTIVNNADVLMPYGWYVNQRLEPHQYYLDAAYQIAPIDTLEEYIATSTSPLDTDVTVAPIGTSIGETAGTTLPNISVPEGMTTRPSSTPVTGTATKYLKSIYVEFTPKLYRVGESFKASSTVVNGVYTDGSVEQLDVYSCGLSGFDTSTVGQRSVGIHYGSLSYRFVIQVIPATAGTATTASRTTTTRIITTTAPRPTTTRTTAAPTTTVTTTVTTTTTTTTAATTKPTLPPTVPRPTVSTEAPTVTEPSEAPTDEVALVTEAPVVSDETP